LVFIVELTPLAALNGRGANSTFILKKQGKIINLKKNKGKITISLFKVGAQTNSPYLVTTLPQENLL
jgi:hypothetical protein